MVRHSAHSLFATSTGEGKSKLSLTAIAVTCQSKSQISAIIVYFRLFLIIVNIINIRVGCLSANRVGVYSIKLLEEYFK